MRYQITVNEIKKKLFRPNFLPAFTSRFNALSPQLLRNRQLKKNISSHTRCKTLKKFIHNTNKTERKEDGKMWANSTEKKENKLKNTHCHWPSHTKWSIARLTSIYILNLPRLSLLSAHRDCFLLCLFVHVLIDFNYLEMEVDVGDLGVFDEGSFGDIWDGIIIE